MKQKDIMLIVVVVIVAAVVSYFISKALFASPTKRKTQVEVVEQIDSSFPEPDQRYFNATAVNPTQLIHIGDNTNPSPFNGGKP
jgi:hypothetical protein